MSNTRNMTIRDVPLEILQRAEQRRRKREREELGATILEGLCYLFGAFAYCAILKAFIR